MQARIGKFVYLTFGWLILRIAVHGTQRARIVILANSEVLLTKSTIGDDKWELPGGGANNGEDVLSAGIREVEEEISVKIDLSKTKLIDVMTISRKGSKYKSHYYLAELGSKPIVKKQWPWILDAKWFKLASLPGDIKQADAQILKNLQLRQ